MANTPKYVRLAERLNRSIVADVESGSGWSIAGLDVKEVPDPKTEPVAYKFVTDNLRNGKLEASNASEYEVVQAANAKVAEAGAFDPETGESHNEGAIQAAVKAAARDLVDGVVSKEDEDEDEDEEDEFEAFNRDELVEYGNATYSLDLKSNISRADALAAVKAAEEAATAS